MLIWRLRKGVIGLFCVVFSLTAWTNVSNTGRYCGQNLMATEWVVTPNEQAPYEHRSFIILAGGVHG